MASLQSTADFIVEQAGGTVSARKMFGDYGVFLDGKMVAVICDDRLFLRQTGAGRAVLGSVTEARPYPRAKAYFLIDGGRWDEDGLLARLFAATAGETPAPKPRTSRKRRAA